MKPADGPHFKNVFFLYPFKTSIYTLWQNGNYFFGRLVSYLRLG